MCGKMRVAVLFGGVSSEHDVSCTSANFVLKNLSSDKYEIIPIGITKEGKWIWFKGQYDKLLDGSWTNCKDNLPAFISPNSEVDGIFIKDGEKYEVIKIDVVFPVLHGKNGEDGSIQGLMQLKQIPFVGCDMSSSSACMDKVVSNTMFGAAKINQADFCWVYDYQINNDIDLCINKIEKELLDYPVFVKPSSAGSSVGVSKARNRKELQEALIVASKEDSKILIEQAIKGKEIECAILGNKDKIVASVLGEIAPTADFYDFDAKYNDSSSQLYIPARIDEDLSEKIIETAKKAYMLMGCAGLSRVDFFVDKNGNYYLNEINTLPGFTSISMYPKLFNNSGISATELIDGLIKLAMER